MQIYNKDGFVWWIGIVEDRTDPLQMGRCRVRIFGYHTDNKTDLPTSDLPWAIPVQPITSAATSGIGNTPIGVLPGTWVVGFFLDGNEKQQPAMFGTIGTYTAKAFVPVPSVAPVTNTNTGLATDAKGNQVLDEKKNPIRTATPHVPGWHIGQTSKRYESGSRGAGAINNYAKVNDPGGASYGTYQFASYLPLKMPNGKARRSSKNSSLLTYLESSTKFGSFFEGLEPATEAFDNMWKEVSSKHPDAFDKDQHRHIKTKFYQVMIDNLKRKGLDLTKFGPAVQDLVWSTAVQLGPNKTSVFLVPLEGKTQLTDKDIVSLVSAYKINNVDVLFKSSGESVKAGVKSRYVAEEQSLNKLIVV